MDEANELKTTSQNIAHPTDAINQLLSLTNCPPNCRSYVDGLVGISRGHDQGEIADHELANHIRGNAGVITKQSQAKWIQRLRKTFDDWQQKLGVMFIECTPGGYDKATGTYHKSHYKLPILRYAANIINEAQNDALWKSDSKLALEVATIHLINELKTTQVVISAKRSYSGYYQTEVRTSLRMAKTKLEKALKYLEDKDSNIDSQDEQLLQDLEHLISKLRQRAEP